jgi:hypothetical protein
MFDEKPEDLAELAAEYHELYSPTNSKGRFPVDSKAKWRGAMPCARRSPKRVRWRAHPYPATRRIQTHFHVRSFVPSQSADPATVSQVARGHALRTAQPEAESAAEPPPPRNPKNPNLLPHPQLRSVTIRKPRTPVRMPRHFPSRTQAQTWQKPDHHP